VCGKGSSCRIPGEAQSTSQHHPFNLGTKNSTKFYRERTKVVMNSLRRNRRRDNKGNPWVHPWAHITTLKPHVAGVGLYVARVARVVLFEANN
jgi:hypothetical protein